MSLVSNHYWELFSVSFAPISMVGLFNFHHPTALLLTFLPYLGLLFTVRQFELVNTVTTKICNSVVVAHLGYNMNFFSFLYHRLHIRITFFYLSSG